MCYYLTNPHNESQICNQHNDCLMCYYLDQSTQWEQNLVLYKTAEHEGNGLLNVLGKPNFATPIPFHSLSSFIIGICLFNHKLYTFLIHQLSYSWGYQWYLNPLSATYNLQQTTISNFAAFSKITNNLKAWYFLRTVGWQTILMKYHTLFLFPKFGKMLQNLPSAAVVIGALRAGIDRFWEQSENRQKHYQSVRAGDRNSTLRS